MFLIGVIFTPRFDAALIVDSARSASLQQPANQPHTFCRTPRLKDGGSLAPVLPRWNSRMSRRRWGRPR
jgi:hypothetical protein